MKNVLALALVALLLATGAAAGTLTPGLELQIRDLPDSAEINVLVVLQDQVDTRTLSQDLHAAKMDNDRQHTVVVSALQDKAAKTQAGLLEDLAAKTRAGVVREYRAYWLINAVRVRTTVAGARELAARKDVDVVEADLVPELIEPVAASKTLPAGTRGVGITDGVVTVGARRVWNELGIDGTGALVGHLDTGVDGNHPALSARWRGNFAPAEHCWYDALDNGSASPTDFHSHGTHVMGTITGLAPDDTIGVAPGALWIATNVIDQGVSSDFDQDVIDCLQFMTDPDGDPATTDDVPDVVQNSWGINEGFTGDYVDCDSRWWDAIDNCEAAGVVLTWSAGNEGSGSGTVRSPADRATDQYNAFSVGSTDETAPYEISYFSSRGPSGCGGDFAIKPEIVAPGDDIYSSIPGGGYELKSGTSMAGPHVAGVVALMRAANPGLDVISIKEILMLTANDLGAPGEENTYGHGMVDAYEAVLMVMTGFGSIEGYVTDVAGLPLPGVRVDATATGEFPRAATTDESGYYRLMLPQGGWDLAYSAFGYLGDAQTLTVVEDQVTDGAMSLTLAPQAVVSGTITLFDGLIADQATVTALDTPLAPVAADASGNYSITVPLGGTYTFQARMNGYAGARAVLTVDGDLTQDFLLGELTHEDFESGDFNNYPWVMSGDAPWVIDTVAPYESDHCARAGAIDDNQASTMSVELDMNEGFFSFWYRVSSESSYDYLRFFIDGEEIASWSGVVPWTRAEFPVAAGTRVFSWSYTKDGSVDSNDDTAWVDWIGEPTWPHAVWPPEGLAETLVTGQTSSQYLTLGNDGDLPLEWTARTVMDLPALQAFAALDLGKDDSDPRRGLSPLAGSGGPDDFGYFWIDSDEPGGPEYGWQDISGIGTARTFTDDDNEEFALPFTFPFYGEDYDTVNVCSNGWLSFTSTSTSYTNQAIPSDDEPNNLIAVFWDDLNPNSAGTIYTYEDAANGRFVVQWDGVVHYGTSDPLWFQVVLNADGIIECHYESIIEPDGATLGLEDADGLNGLQVVFNAAYVHDGLTLVYDFTQPWLDLPVDAGVVEVDGEAMIEVVFDASETPDGIYTGSLVVETNDPEAPQIIVPLELVVTGSVGVDAPTELPSRYALHANYPNPFNPITTIAFDLPVRGAAKLAVYDLSGRLVKELKNEVMSATRHQVTWDGTDVGGKRVASGTYYLRLKSGDFEAVRQMTLVK